MQWRQVRYSWWYGTQCGILNILHIQENSIIVFCNNRRRHRQTIRINCHGQKPVIFDCPSVEISCYSLFLSTPRHSNQSFHLLTKLDPRDRPVTRQKNMAFIGILKDKCLHGLVSHSIRRGLTLFPIHLDKGFAGLDKISWDTSLVWHPLLFVARFHQCFLL